jgi:hypothetical protein
VPFLHRAKGHGHQGPHEDDVLCGIPKGRKFEKRRRGRPKRNNGIRDPGVRRELRLRSREIFYEALRLIIIMQEAVNSSLKPAKLFIENRGNSELLTLGISHKMNQYVNLINALVYFLLRAPKYL